jgi:hypothetical protein
MYQESIPTALLGQKRGDEEVEMSGDTPMDTTAHPEDELLIAHAAGDLTVVASMPVIAHLVACPECARTVERYAVVRGVVREDDSVEVPAALLAQVHALFAAARPTFAARASEALAPARRLVADLVFDSWGRLAPGFAAVRGASDGRQFSWNAGEIDVDVQVLPAAPGASSLRLVGQVGGAAFPVGSIALTRENGEQAAFARPDAFGAFSLDAPAGIYDLELIIEDALLILPGVEVGQG